MELILSLLTGFACAVFAARLGLLDRVLSRPPSQTDIGVPERALEELRGLAPDLFEEIRQPPAVDVDDVPEELEPEVVESVRGATEEEAAAIIRKRVRDRDTADVLTVLARWNARYADSEGTYEARFVRRLREKGFAAEIEEKPRVTWPKKGTGLDGRQAIPDLAIRGRVLVELKANLRSSAEADRALGQMLRYLLAWKQTGTAVLVVCGDVAPEMHFLVRHYIHVWRTTLRLPVTVYFLRGENAPAIEQAKFLPR
jgi:hypothetical protein